MRISDWSSDVCSSDLCGPWPAALRFHPRVWTVKPDPLPGDAHHEAPVALPALVACVTSGDFRFLAVHRIFLGGDPAGSGRVVQAPSLPERARKDRKSTRLNSSH